VPKDGQHDWERHRLAGLSPKFLNNLPRSCHYCSFAGFNESEIEVNDEDCKDYITGAEEIIDLGYTVDLNDLERAKITFFIPYSEFNPLQLSLLFDEQLPLFYIHTLCPIWVCRNCGDPEISWSQPSDSEDSPCWLQTTL